MDNLVEIVTKPTADLEMELRDLSTEISTLTERKARFNTITEELKRRLDAPQDERPDVRPPTPTAEEMLQRKLEDADRVIRTLSLKVTEMEAEQARLVVEKEQAKYEKKEAEEQLALVRKYYKPADNA